MRRLSSLRCCVWAGALGLPWLACSKPETAPSFPILVHVESDPSAPLSGARLRASGRVLGVTDTAGRIALSLHGKPGDVLALQLVCPDGYRSPEAALSVLLRAHEPGQPDPEYRLVCSPLTREVVIAVRASAGPHLPLHYLGQEIARTDASGVAHALVRARPGELLRVTLDTSSEPELMPQHPELKLIVPDRDELVVFDQRFTRPMPKPRPKRKPRAPKGPQRI